MSEPEANMVPLSLETYLGKHVFYNVPAGHPAIKAVADLDMARLDKSSKPELIRSLLSVVRASMEEDDPLWTFVANYSYNEGKLADKLKLKNAENIEDTARYDLASVEFVEGHVSGSLSQTATIVAIPMPAKK
uniref:Uncharacterized protein n=1 Tax=viral metagenome TaxID=1070528 RepID=A0A6C0HLS5_9ZZZZ